MNLPGHSGGKTGTGKQMLRTVPRSVCGVVILLLCKGRVSFHTFSCTYWLTPIYTYIFLVALSQETTFNHIHNCFLPF